MKSPTLSRRAFCSAAALALAGCSARPPGWSDGVVVNDIHAGISRTTVGSVREPTTTGEVLVAMQDERATLCGGRYCSGGQWRRTDGVLLDTQRMSRVLDVDAEAGTVTAEAGARWPAVLDAIEREAPGWAVRQKQSGANEVSLGGTLSVNAHGRCLTAPPIVDDVLNVDVLLPTGARLTCSREENADRFARVIGGYGMFGAILTATLKLVPDDMLRRRTRLVSVEDAVAELDDAAARGATYGDFQYVVDESSERYLREGLCVTYEPTDGPATRRAETAEGFAEMAVAAHVDKPRAWAAYEASVLDGDGATDTTNGWQRALYLPGYHRRVDAATVGGGSEVLSELFVPRGRLPELMEAMREVTRRRGANVIYGNVRLIEPDTVTALPWARGRFACVVFNQHVDAAGGGMPAFGATFRELVDATLALGGTYYLPYHRAASPAQVVAAHPALPGLLAEAETAWSDRPGQTATEFTGPHRAERRGSGAYRHPRGPTRPPAR